jgi:ketosteroid isomerase-like protein
MSEENVEVVRRVYAAFNRGDLGTVLEIPDPEIEFNSSDIFFDQPRTYPRKARVAGGVSP